MVKLALFSFFFAGIIVVNAQTNFLPGYYVTADHDTVHGYIEYRSVLSNSKRCLFKKDLNSKAVRIYPEGISGFVIDDKVYYEVHSFKSRKGEELLGFFKVLIRGKLSLLRHASQYFVQAQDEKIYEVSKHEEVKEGKLKTDFYGLGMLRVLTKDCGEVSQTLQQEFRTTPDFVHIVRTYNECVGSPVYEAPEIVIKPHVNAGVQFGAAVTDLRLSGSTLSNARLGKDLSFAGGGFVSIFHPKAPDNIRLVIEASFGGYDNYAFFKNSYLTSASTNNDLFLKYYDLKVPVLMRYQFTNRLFLDVGYQTDLIMSQHSKWRVEFQYQDVVETSHTSLTPFPSRIGGYIAGLGMRHTVLNHTLRSFIRYSYYSSYKHVNEPVFDNLAIYVSMQLK